MGRWGHVNGPSGCSQGAPELVVDGVAGTSAGMRIDDVKVKPLLRKVLGVGDIQLRSGAIDRRPVNRWFAVGCTDGRISRDVPDTLLRQTAPCTAFGVRTEGARALRGALVFAVRAIPTGIAAVLLAVTIAVNPVIAGPSINVAAAEITIRSIVILPALTPIGGRVKARKVAGVAFRGNRVKFVVDSGIATRVPVLPMKLNKPGTTTGDCDVSTGRLEVVTRASSPTSGHYTITCPPKVLVVAIIVRTAETAPPSC
mmetsp:Transcript_131789/g.228360  ORF Transcript_131789/g.228360 Transcript_131789/m.228360 type:complete len:256 (-) Transcript_131789:317-1084(-)